MRGVLAFALVATAALSSCGSVLTVRATMPTTGGSCDGTEPLSGPLWLNVQWVGPLGARAQVIRRDSVSSMPGQAALWRWDGEPGVYAMRVWASNRAGAGCETTYVDTASAKPSRVTVAR